MVALAPQLCPVCDRPFDHKLDEFEIARTEFFHVKENVKCVRECGQPAQEKIPAWACRIYNYMEHWHMTCTACSHGKRRWVEFKV